LNADTFYIDPNLGLILPRRHGGHQTKIRKPCRMGDGLLKNFPLIPNEKRLLIKGFEVGLNGPFGGISE
jgi:hypothetical protein